MQNARSHSSVFIRSIQVCECAFALHQEKKRDHFGTVAIGVHRMFHHDSTALTTRASGLGRTSAGLLHIHGVHMNLRTNPVDPSSPLQTSTHTITLIVLYCFMNTEFHRCLVLSSSMRVIQFPCAEQGCEGFCPVDPGISRAVTDLRPSRGYTPPGTRAIEVLHAACKEKS